MLSCTGTGSGTKYDTADHSRKANQACDLKLFAYYGDDGDRLAQAAEDMRSTPWWGSVPTNEYTYLKSAETSGEC